MLQAQGRGFPDQRQGTKWQQLHERVKEELPPMSCAVPCSADDLLLHLPRERDAWDILLRSCSAGGTAGLVADLSQTVTRSRAVAGKLPTITPGSVLAMAGQKRILSPLEKILLHAFPIHRMTIPTTTTQKQLQEAGGNTMHVQVVGCALFMLLSLVDWSLSGNRAPPTTPPKGARLCKRLLRTGGALAKKHAKRHPPLVSKKLLGSLAARWGLCPKSPKKVVQKRFAKTQQRGQRAAQQPRHIRALVGTRWG